MSEPRKTGLWIATVWLHREGRLMISRLALPTEGLEADDLAQLVAQILVARFADRVFDDPFPIVRFIAVRFRIDVLRRKRSRAKIPPRGKLRNERQAPEQLIELEREECKQAVEEIHAHYPGADAQAARLAWELGGYEQAAARLNRPIDSVRSSINRFYKMVRGDLNAPPHWREAAQGCFVVFALIQTRRRIHRRLAVATLGLVAFSFFHSVGWFSGMMAIVGERKVVAGTIVATEDLAGLSPPVAKLPSGGLSDIPTAASAGLDVVP